MPRVRRPAPGLAEWASSVPPSIGKLQASQLPVHALSQHTPSAQESPAAHEFPAPQGLPCVGAPASGPASAPPPESASPESASPPESATSVDGLSSLEGPSSPTVASLVGSTGRLASGVLPGAVPVEASPASCSPLPRMALHPVSETSARTNAAKSQDRITTYPSIAGCRARRAAPCWAPCLSPWAP